MGADHHRRALIWAAIALLGASAPAAAGQCRASLEKLQQLELLHGMEILGGVQVYMGRTFFNLSHDARANVVRNVNCLIVRGQDKCVEFNVRHWQSGAVVGRHHLCRYRVK